MYSIKAYKFEKKYALELYILNVFIVLTQFYSNGRFLYRN